MNLESVLVQHWPIGLLAFCCYGAGWLMRNMGRQAAREVDVRLARGDGRIPPALFVFAAWHKVFVPATSVVLGLFAGMMGAPGFADADMNVLVGLACGFGPVVFKSFIRDVRKSSAGEGLAEGRTDREGR